MNESDQPNKPIKPLTKKQLAQKKWGEDTKPRIIEIVPNQRYMSKRYDCTGYYEIVRQTINQTSFWQCGCRASIKLGRCRHVDELKVHLAAA